MNKFLKKINPKDLIGMKIYSEESEEYVIEYAGFNDKQNLEIVFVNEKDAQKDDEHKKGLADLRKELAKGNAQFNEDKGYIWKIRYAQFTVFDPLLTNHTDDEGRVIADFNYYIRSDSDSFYISYGEDADDVINDINDVRRCVYDEIGIIGGLRGIFRRLLGKEYEDELREHYINEAKKHIASEKEEAKSNIEYEQKRLKNLENQEKELYGEESRKIFEGDDEEQVRLPGIEDEEDEESEESFDDDDFLDDLFFD